MKMQSQYDTTQIGKTLCLFRKQNDALVHKSVNVPFEDVLGIVLLHIW